MANEQKTDVQAETDADIFLECKARLEIAIACEGQNRSNALDALNFRYVEQWPDDTKNERDDDGRPALTVNHTDTLCRKTENQIKQARPRIKAHPLDSKSDPDTAETVNGLLRHIENISDASIAYDRAAASALDIGWGYARIISKYCYEMGYKDAGYSDQELLITCIRNALTCYDDPSAVHPTGCDRRWFIISAKMKRAAFKRQYPNQELNDFNGSQGAGDYTLDWENKEDIRLAEYYRIHEKQEWLYCLSDGQAILESELPSEETRQAIGLTFAMNKDGSVVRRKTCVEQVQWFKLNGTKVVDRRDLPGYWIPVVRCLGNEIDVNGEVIRWGMVKNMMEPAQMFNYWTTMATERYALAPKAPWVGAEGQFDGHPEWDDANQKSYSVLKYKPTVGPNGELLPAPQRTPPAPVEAGMSEAAQAAERNLMAMAGMLMEQPQEQRIIGGNKYLQRKQAERDLSHFQYFDNQTLFIAQIGRICLDSVPYYYDTPRMQRIIGEDGTAQMVKLNDKQTDEETGVDKIKNDMTVGKYDVVMDAGPSYQTKREESSETMLNLADSKIGEQIVKVGSDLIVRNMDFAGAQELADRLAVTTPKGFEKAIENLPKQAQTIVKTLMAQNQQLSEQLQQAVQEIKTKAGIEQMRQEGETHRTLIKTGTDDKNSERDFTGWMHDIDVKSITARDVAEIHGATALLNTRQEAEANDKAADKMIAAGLKDRAEA